MRSRSTGSSWKAGASWWLRAAGCCDVSMPGMTSFARTTRGRAPSGPRACLQRDPAARGLVRDGRGLGGSGRGPDGLRNGEDRRGGLRSRRKPRGARSPGRVARRAARARGLIAPGGCVGAAEDGGPLTRPAEISVASDYLGGNCEFGTGSSRFCVGGLSVNPITAQLMSTPEAPYGAGWPVAGSTPVSRSGRVAARLKTTFSSIWRVLSPC